MKKRMRKLVLAKDTLVGLDGSVVQGGAYFDLRSNTAGLNMCICPRLLTDGEHCG